MISIEFSPDPTKPTTTLAKTQPPTPTNTRVRISDIVGDTIEIGLPISSGNIIIRGDFDVWYFSPDQAVAVAGAILGYVDKQTGRCYAINMVA